MQRYERGLLGHCLSVFRLPHRLPFRVLYKLPISYVSRRSLLFPSPLCRLCSTGLLSPTQCAPLPMLSRFNAVAHETSARHGGVQGKHQKLFRCSYRLARVLSPLGRTSSRLEIYAACMGDYEGAAAPAGTLQEVQIPSRSRSGSGRKARTVPGAILPFLRAVQFRKPGLDRALLRLASTMSATSLRSHLSPLL